MLSAVYNNMWQFYQGCTTSIIKAVRDVQYPLSVLSVWSTFINFIVVIRDVEHLSILSGVYNNLLMVFVMYNIFNVIRGVQ